MERASDLLRAADRVAIVDAQGRVVEPIRGVMKGELLDAPGPSLVVCGATGACDVAPERGGFFVLSVYPGLIERRAVAALASRADAPELCVRAKVHVLGQPKADEVIEGRFSASDGNGKLERSRLFGTEIGAQLAVGFPPHTNMLVATIELDLVNSRFALVGGPIARGKDGCFTLDVLPDPLVITPAGFARAAKDDVPVAAIVAMGAWPLSVVYVDARVATNAPIRIEASGSELRYVSAGDIGIATGRDGRRIAFVSRRDGTTRWLEFDKLAPPLPGASLAATVAASVADGKQHVVRVFAGGDAGAHEIATATLRRPPE